MIFSIIRLVSVLLTLTAASLANGRPIGDKIEVRLIPDKARIILGEPTGLTFEVTNNSDVDLTLEVGGDYRNQLGRPETFTVTALDALGKEIPMIRIDLGMGGFGGPEKLRQKETYRFSLFLPAWLNFDKVGTYEITVQRALDLTPDLPEDDPLRQSGRENMTSKAKCQIDVIAYDRNRMCQLIEEWRAACPVDSNNWLPTPNAKAAFARNALSYIPDDRVIPYFAKMFELPDYGKKFEALSALAKFDQPAAFEILKRGIAIQDSDLKDHSNSEAIRHCAAAALAQSPHANARAFLISKRTDSSIGVRNTILHVLGDMKPDEALPILEKMTHDTDENIRTEANRYVKLLSKRQ